MNWKKILIEALKKLELIDEKFNGELTIVINQGGIRTLKKTQIVE